MATYNIGSWATVNDGGDTSGNGSLAVTCGNEFFGRRDRRGYARLTTGTSGNVATLDVVQEGLEEFVNLIAPSNNPDASGGSCVVTGTTNSSKLTFTITGAAAAAVTLPANYTVQYGAVGNTQTLTIANGSAITGDPGTDNLLSFSITLTIAANTTPSARTFSLVATPNSGTAATLAITQSAGLDYVCFDSASGPTNKTITFNSKGYINSESSVDVLVFSNDNWSITTGTN